MIGQFKNVIRQFWQEIISAVFTEKGIRE